MGIRVAQAAKHHQVTIERKISLQALATGKAHTNVRSSVTVGDQRLRDRAKSIQTHTHSCTRGKDPATAGGICAVPSWRAGL